MVDGAQGAVHVPADVQQLVLISMLSLVTNCMARRVSACVWQIRTAGSDVTLAGWRQNDHEVSFDGFTTQSAPWKLEAERQMSLVS